jgi:3-oxoacyl-[acyl-carrier-protein] synthase-3
MIYSKIAGTGRYLPERVLTNADLEDIVETTDEWIRTRTGVERRHLAAEEETTSSLCIEAAKAAIEAANIRPEDIDLIVIGTTTPDLVFPNIATLVQQALDIHGCPAFSIEAACTGFIYALATADKFIRAGESQCALVIGAEIITKLVDWSDRTTCVLFGDGAGAVIVKPSDEPGIISTHLGADGQYKELLYYPVGPSKDLITAGSDKVGIIMRGNEVFKVAVKTLGAVAQEALEANGIDRTNSTGSFRTRQTFESFRPPQNVSTCPWKKSLLPYRITATPPPRRSRWHSTLAFGMAGSSAVNWCCWRPSVVALPGAPS